MICPSCGKLIGLDEPRCPFCGAWRPGLYGWSPVLQRFFGRRLDLVGMIVGACVVLYVISLALDPMALFRFTGIFSILSPSSRALYQLGMTGGFAWGQGWWWTVLTAIYLHGNLLHIFFNMMWVRNLGPALEEVYGSARGFIIFSFAGAVGFVVSNLASGVPTIGASGSIFGLLAALIVHGRRTGHTLLTRQLWQWAIIVFVLGFVMSGVNNWGHAGGFAGGWIAAQVLPSRPDGREHPAIQLAALGLILVTVAGFVLSFIRVTSAIMAG